jgi:hypothetical protein
MYHIPSFELSPLLDAGNFIGNPHITKDKKGLPGRYFQLQLSDNANFFPYLMKISCIDTLMDLMLTGFRRELHQGW